MRAKKGLKITGFKPEKRKDKLTGLLKTENVPILVDFKFDDQRVIYPIGYRIDFDKWSESEQRVKRNNFNKDLISASVINRRINQIDIKLPEIYNNAVELSKPITSKLLLDELNRFLIISESTHPDKSKIATQDPQQNVIDYLQLFIDTESRQKNWTEGTKTKLTTLKNQLSNYRPKLQFNEITAEFLQDYIDYQRKDLKHNNNTNHKKIELLYWFLNWATKKDYNTNLDYHKFEHKFKGVSTGDYKKNIVFLSWDELQHLNNLDFSDINLFIKYEIDFVSNKKLERIRDIYCFCCFTSLRYSDIAHLKKNDIKTDNNRNHYIEILTVKTDDKLNIELNKYALAIWEKYKDIELINNRLFPVPSNQKYNAYLKDVAKLAGFKSIETVIEYRGNQRIEKTFEKWELITTHTARKTFIINALYLGIQPDIIRSWTGHKDHKTMELYIKIVSEQKRVSMNKFNDI
ncbi:MAG: phage integrase SAM-like domain-containing protein [Bacteroidales bacterium]